MSVKSSSGQTSSKMSLPSSQSMNLAKTLQVQDQIIEQLRADQTALREALEAERQALRDCRITSDRELKALQRENFQISKTAKHHEVKVEELEKALSFAKDALACEQRNLKSLEKEHVAAVKELKLKNSREYDKSNKQEMIIDQLKSEIEDLKEALESERNATNLLIREHNAEVKMLREEVRAKSTEAYRELKERAIRERDEYREIQEEAEKTYKVLEKDFREALASKDEELKKVKAESRLIQKELEDQLRACLKEPTPHLTSPTIAHHDYLSNDKMRKLKSEISLLKEQNRKLLNELEILAGKEKINEIKKENCFIQPSPDDGKTHAETTVIFRQPEKAARAEINRLGSESTIPPKLGEIRSQNRTITKLQRELSLATQALDKVRHQDKVEASATRAKPPLPAKPNTGNRVRNMVRRLQQTTPTLMKPAANQTMADLKAIDQDIENLRKQIEERDKIISALREAAEAKDKKMDILIAEYTKVNPSQLIQECKTEKNPTAFSTSPSPPVCNGEPCWTDGFVNKNYHEPIYAQLLSDHTALRKVYHELRERLDTNRKPETQNGINLIMAEQIRILKEREAQLMSEAEDLREQNDLMEFRILELEECRKEEMLHKSREEKVIWDLEEVSDSGVMSLPTSEDLTSDSELGDTIKNYLQTDGAIVPTLFPKIQIGCSESPTCDSIKKKTVKTVECLQESGIFEESELLSEGHELNSKATQTESLLEKTLLEIIDGDLILSRREPPKTSQSDDLTAEISKLTEIQKRIVEKEGQTQTCPHSNTVIFYEERLAQLEDKLRIYESSGDEQDALLKKRLQKEIELSHTVKELRDKVSSLEAVNRQIEEERCELEEAENDSRFQCQRLEATLREAMEKNSELELELERRKMMMAGDSKKEDSIAVMEAALPAILAWHMFCLNETKEEISEKLEVEQDEEKEENDYPKAIAYPDNEVFQKLEELIADQKQLRMEYEKAEEEARLREENLKRKIEELEGKSAKDRETLEEMTNHLKTVRGETSSEGSAPLSTELEMFDELKRLTKNEAEMRRKIDILQRKEQAYIQTLQQVDEIWAGMEADYKKRLVQAEGDGARLRNKVNELEKALKKETDMTRNRDMDLTQKMNALTAENEQLRRRMTDGELDARVKTLEEENIALGNLLRTLQEELPVEKKRSESLSVELQQQKEESQRDKETIQKLEEKSSRLHDVEISLHGQISDLTRALHAKGKELSNLEVTVAELREEVETLENKVTELAGVVPSADLQTDSRHQDITAEERHKEPSSESSIVAIKVKRPKKPNRVRSLEVPNSIAEQLIREAPEVPPRCKRVVILDHSTLSESEVSLPMDDSKLAAREVVVAFERGMPVVIFLNPETEPQPPIYVEIPSMTPSPVVLIQKPEAPLRTRKLTGYANREVIVESKPESIGETQTTEWTDKEADISELGVKNEMLQKTLEKMEEESRLKNHELTELYKTVSEMRREQLELENKLIEKTCPVESKATECDDAAQFGIAEDDEESEDDHEKEPSAWQSTLPVPDSQVDPDNLQNKPFVVLPEKVDYSQGFCQPLVKSGSDLLFTAPITELRKVGEDRVFLQWDTRGQPSAVTGFEICVNGILRHRVRCSTRNKALVHDVDFLRRNIISLYPVSSRGRSNRCTTVVIPVSS